MITFLGNPLSTNHIYRNRGHMRYMTKEGHAVKEGYQWEAKTQWKNEVLFGNIELAVWLYFADKRKRDIDNYNKLLLDAMSGIVYLDDKQIQKITIIKGHDKKNPRIEVNIKKYGTK